MLTAVATVWSKPLTDAERAEVSGWPLDCFLTLPTAGYTVHHKSAGAAERCIPEAAMDILSGVALLFPGTAAEYSVERFTTGRCMASMEVFAPLGEGRYKLVFDSLLRADTPRLAALQVYRAAWEASC